MRAATTAAWRLALALTGASLTLAFFSEFYFFNEAPALAVADATGPVEMLGATLALFPYYFLFAAVLSASLSLGRGAGWPDIALAGALTGWAIEALLVPVVHEAPPISWAWPSLGWHMIVCVGVGCFGCVAALRRGGGVGIALSVALAVILGLIWGIWATWVWPDGIRLTPPAFAAFAAVTALSGLMGLALLVRWGGYLWAMPAGLRWAVAALALGFASITGAFHWLSLLGVGALAGLTAAALAYRGRRIGARAKSPPGSGAPFRALVFVATPVSAAACYAWISTAGWMAPLGDIPIFLTFAGVCIYFAALLRVFTSG